MNKILNSKRIKCIIVVLIVFYLLPFLYSIYLSVPRADDFSFANKIDKTNILVSSIEQTKWYYFNWQGNWFYVFLMFIINPLVLFGLNYRAYGFEMIVLTIIFFISVLFVLSMFYKHCLKIKKDNLFLVIYGLLLLVLTNQKVYSEVYYWFDGSNYMWALTISLFTSGLLFKYFDIHGFHCLIGVSILSFLSATCYQLAPFVGLTWLALFVNKFKKNGKISLLDCLPILFMLAGGIIAVVAPGNFVRKGSSVSPFPTLAYAFIDVFRVMISLYSNPITMIALVLFTIIGCFLFKDSKFNFKYPIIPVFVHLFCLYIMCYPAALAYGGTSITYPNRMNFIMDGVSLFYILIIGLYFGGWLSKNFTISLTKDKLILTFLFLFLFVYVCLFPTNKYENEAYYYTVNNLIRIKECSNEGKRILNDISNSNKKIIVIEKGNSYDELKFDFDCLLTENIDFWTNKAISEYFDKDSVKCITISD